MEPVLTAADDNHIIEGLEIIDGLITKPGIRYSPAEYRLKLQMDRIEKKIDQLLRQADA